MSMNTERPTPLTSGERRQQYLKALDERGAANPAIIDNEAGKEIFARLRASQGRIIRVDPREFGEAVTRSVIENATKKDYSPVEVAQQIGQKVGLDLENPYIAMLMRTAGGEKAVETWMAASVKSVEPMVQVVAQAMPEPEALPSPAELTDRTAATICAFLRDGAVGTHIRLQERADHWNAPRFRAALTTYAAATTRDELIKEIAETLIEEVGKRGHPDLWDREPATLPEAARQAATQLAGDAGGEAVRRTIADSHRITAEVSWGLYRQVKLEPDTIAMAVAALQVSSRMADDLVRHCAGAYAAAKPEERVQMRKLMATLSNIKVENGLDEKGRRQFIRFAAGAEEDHAAFRAAVEAAGGIGTPAGRMPENPKSLAEVGGADERASRAARAVARGVAGDDDVDPDLERAKTRFGSLSRGID